MKEPNKQNEPNAIAAAFWVSLGMCVFIAAVKVLIQ